EIDRLTAIGTTRLDLDHVVCNGGRSTERGRLFGGALLRLLRLFPAAVVALGHDSLLNWRWIAGTNGTAGWRGRAYFGLAISASAARASASVRSRTTANCGLRAMRSVAPGSLPAKASLKSSVRSANATLPTYPPCCADE